MRRACAVAMLSLAACSISPTPATSPEAPASSGSGAVFTLPAGYREIDLRSPRGQRVDLTGEWAGGNWFSGRSAGERTFILQLGDCVWISISDSRFRANPEQGSSLLGVLLGHVSSDFAVTGDLVTILRDAPVGGFSDQQTFAAVRLLIEFDAEGQTTLREDRQAQVQGPRCTDPPNACPEPLRLSRVGD